LATSWIEKTAKGEPKEAGRFVLSASANSYEITRLWGSDKESYEGIETMSILRRELPAGCETARFFLNDSTHQLQIAQLTWANWITGSSPPLPDNSYPSCALLVSYGYISETSSMEGVTVASASGIIATSERKQPQPTAWILLPLGLVADIYIFIGGLVTMPVWGPIGLMIENSDAKKEQEAKEQAKRALPPPVSACWTTIDNIMKKEGDSRPAQPFVKFEWAHNAENAYILKSANESFSDDKPVPIDERVTLRQGRVNFRIVSMMIPLWTDAEIECDLRLGKVVETRVKLRD